MHLHLQQMQAEGRVDAEVYRTCMLLTVMTKLIMALVVGVLVACSFLII
jgi:MFS superfamily sulfate permease-like transporter